MADIFPLSLNQGRQFFDAENIPIRNVGPPQLSSDAVSYGVLSKTAITNTSSTEELNNVLDSYVDDKTIAQILASKILMVDNFHVSSETIQKISELLSKTIDGKTFAEHLEGIFQMNQVRIPTGHGKIQTLASQSGLQTNLHPGPQEKDSIPILTNFYADSDVSSVIEKSIPNSLLTDVEKTYQEMYEKKASEHKDTIVQELFDALIKNTLKYHECCDILLNCSTKNWVKSIEQEYRFMKRSDDFFFDVKEAFFVFEYENGKYVMKNITPAFLKPVLSRTNFNSVVMKSFDTSLENLEVQANSISPLIKDLEDKSIVKVAMIEGVFDLNLDLNLGTTSTILVSAGFSVKK